MKTQKMYILKMGDNEPTLCAVNVSEKMQAFKLLGTVDVQFEESGGNPQFVKAPYVADKIISREEAQELGAVYKSNLEEVA